MQIMAYVGQATGREPSQEEIATVLKTYFTIDEVCNQISYLKKEPLEASASLAIRPTRSPSQKINLLRAPRKNFLARAGFFIDPVAEALAGIRKHAQAMTGAQPSPEEIALSLISSFILSELKNQVVHARKKSNPDRNAGS